MKAKSISSVLNSKPMYPDDAKYENLEFPDKKKLIRR